MKANNFLFVFKNKTIKYYRAYNIIMPTNFYFCSRVLKINKITDFKNVYQHLCILIKR